MQFIRFEFPFVNIAPPFLLALLLTNNALFIVVFPAVYIAPPLFALLSLKVTLFKIIDPEECNAPPMSPAIFPLIKIMLEIVMLFPVILNILA